MRQPLGDFFFLTRLAPMERSGETLIVHIKLILIEFVFNRALRNRFAAAEGCGTVCIHEGESNLRYSFVS